MKEKKLWCPFSRCLHIEDWSNGEGESLASFNRYENDDDIPAGSICLGDKCAIWLNGYCGLAGKA